MTRITKMPRTCSVCGTTSEQAVCLSTCSFGSPDLDLRPPQLARSTMSTWYEKCPECGYVAVNIEKIEMKNSGYLETDEYRSLEGMPQSRKTPDMARDFYQLYLIANHDGDTESAFHALLHSAWCCDDHCDKETARALRVKCLEQLVEFDDEMEPAGGTRAVIMADLMRRARMFDDVAEQFDGMDLGEEMLTKLLAYEVELARKHDDKCHAVSETIKD